MRFERLRPSPKSILFHRLRISPRTPRTAYRIRPNKRRKTRETARSGDIYRVTRVLLALYAIWCQYC